MAPVQKLQSKQNSRRPRSHVSCIWWCMQALWLQQAPARPVQYSTTHVPSGHVLGASEAPLNGQIARAFVLSLINWVADDWGTRPPAPVEAAGGGSRNPVYRWHLGSSHVRLPHLAGVFSPSLRKGSEDLFIYHRKEDAMFTYGRRCKRSLLCHYLAYLAYKRATVFLSK